METVNTSVVMPIAKVDEQAHIIYGVVYKAAELDDKGKPSDNKVIDTQGNWATAEEVKKACHNFNRKLQQPKKLALKKDAGVDKQHNEVAGYGVVLESYIAKSDIADINAAPGDWVAAVEVTDKGCWDEILKGDIEGFSIGGTAKIIPTEGGENDE